jgi:ABC-type transport system involved in multi-copper enzyme maturation permease subunit
MTTTAGTVPSAPTPFVSRMTVEPVSQPQVITSEWLKLTTLRSSWVTMTLGIGALALLGGVIGFFLNRDWDRLRPARQAAFDAVGTSLGGARFTELAIGVLGVLFVTGEYGTGMIRSSLTAVPKRLPVLWAKLLVLGAVSLVLTEIASFAGFIIGQATLGTHAVALSSDGALRAVIGTGLYLTVVALIGVELGFIIRSTAGGIAALVAILLVLPGVVSILPQSWQDTISPYLPSNAGAAIYDLRPEPGTLSPWTGFAVFCLYAVAGLAAAAVVLKRRDA